MLSIKERLEQIKKETEEATSERALDFVGDYSIENINYFSDCVQEFADNSISVYYSDQFKYYEEHPTESEDALLELYDPNSIAEMIKKNGLYCLCCHAGVCGEYNEITSDLYQEEENIKRLLVVRYLLKNDLFNITEEQLEEILDTTDTTDTDSLEEIVDLINEMTTGE